MSLMTMMRLSVGLIAPLALWACASTPDATDPAVLASATGAPERFPRGAQLAPEGYATILDAPPAPFGPVHPGEPEPPTPEQIAAQQQFARAARFQNTVTEEAQALNERLRTAEQGNYVSVYYDNEGQPSVVFQFLRNGPETLRRYSDNPHFVGKTVRFSKEELMAAADFMWETFREDRVLQSTGIGRNEVEAQISVSREDFLALVERKGVKIPEAMELVFGAGPIVPLVAPPVPARSDSALPEEIASFVRIFPRDDRPTGIVHSIESRAKVVLRDGCFRLADRDDALVLFPLGASLFVDEEGFLAFGEREVPGYARVGETMSFTGSLAEVATPELVEPIHAACGPGKVLKINGTESAYAKDRQQELADQVNALRQLQETYGLTAGQSQRAFDFLAKRQAARPQQVTPDGIPFPPCCPRSSSAPRRVQ